MSIKNIVIAISVLPMLSGCVSPPDPSQLATTGYKGQTAYVITGSTIYARGPYDGRLGTPLTEAEINSAAQEAETGKQPVGLPFQTSAACPNGYHVLKRSKPITSFYMILATGNPAYRISQTYTVLCK